MENNEIEIIDFENKKNKSNNSKIFVVILTVLLVILIIVSLLSNKEKNVISFEFKSDLLDEAITENIDLKEYIDLKNVKFDDLTFNVSDKNVIDIENGVVILKNTGVSSITATYKEIEKKINISVYKEEDITFSNSELEKYVNYISPEGKKVSDLLYNVEHINSKELSVADKINYISTLVYSMHTQTSDAKYSIISENDVKNVVEEVYGPNTYERTTFKLGCGEYIFNENDSNYYSKTGCGGATSIYASNVIVDYVASKTKLEITTAYVFFDITTNKIYKDYNRSDVLDDYYVGSSDANKIDVYLQEYVKSNKNKLNTIVYTFESTDGINYYFKEFTNNK